MTNNLMPEPRVNKLGHVVTKHVIQPGSGTLGRRVLPAPSIADPAQRKQATRSAIEALRAAGLPLANVNYTNKNIYHLVNKNPDLLERLVSQIKQADESEKSFWNVIISGESRHAVAKTSNYDASFEYERDMHLAPLACQLVYNQAKNPSLPKAMIIDAYRRLEGIVEPEDFSTMGAAVIAIAIEKNYGSGPYEFDYDRHAETLSYIAEHPNEVISIAGELIARETIDKNVMETILAVSSPSLRDGAL